MSAKNPKASKPKSPAGRKSVFTAEVIRKIEEVAALDGSVEEMAFYAGIHRDTIYKKFKSDPAFFDRIEGLRLRPVLKARQTVVKTLEHSYGNAMDYLSRKRKVEFSPRTELTGADGKDLPQPIMALPSHVPPNDGHK